MPELTTREHLERVIDDVALALAHGTDDKVRPLLPTMRMSLQTLFSKHDLGLDAKDLSELMVSNIIATCESIHLGEGQMSRVIH